VGGPVTAFVIISSALSRHNFFQASFLSAFTVCSPRLLETLQSPTTAGYVDHRHISQCLSSDPPRVPSSGLHNA